MLDTLNPPAPSKICTKCKKSYPATPEYFHRHSANKVDGLYPQCKTCKNGYLKTPAGKDAIKRKTNKWRKTPNGLALGVKKTQQRRAIYPEKFQAIQAVRSAIDHFRLKPVSDCLCAKCGMTAKEYHHWSYNPEHWTNVIPLCKVCHTGLHRMSLVNRAKIEAELLGAD